MCSICFHGMLAFGAEIIGRITQPAIWVCSTQHSSRLATDCGLLEHPVIFLFWQPTDEVPVFLNQIVGFIRIRSWVAIVRCSVDDLRWSHARAVLTMGSLDASVATATGHPTRTARQASSIADCWVHHPHSPVLIRSGLSAKTFQCVIVKEP